MTATPAPYKHAHLLAIMITLPTDYEGYGTGRVERTGMDCSCGCRWAEWLKGAIGEDWCVCTNPASPRAGMLTFEHMAGHGCFEAKQRRA